MTELWQPICFNTWSLLLYVHYLRHPPFKSLGVVAVLVRLQHGEGTSKHGWTKPCLLCLPSVSSRNHVFYRLFLSAPSPPATSQRPLVVVRRYCIEIHGVCDRLCLQTQLADAEQRICDLEAELARSKLELSMQSHTTPAGPCSKCRSMEAVHREVLSQVSVPHSFKSVWKVPGDYHNVRSSAFANLCAGSPSKVG